MAVRLDKMPHFIVEMWITWRFLYKMAHFAYLFMKIYKNKRR